VAAGAGRPDRGGAAVELAILWPVVLLLIFAGVQAATYFTARTVALSAAQVGVAAERRYDAAPGSGRSRAEQFLAGAGDWLVHPEVDPPVRTGQQVSLTVRGEALAVVPGVSWEIEQTARGTVERFTEPP
jgi:hypothetical protein